MKTLPLAISLLALPAFAQEDAKKAPATRTIVETAIEAGKFNTLVAAVQAADLVETLSGDGPFTVFAPTDAAFAKLGEDTLAALLKPEAKAKLTSILTYHVAAGSMPAAKVVKTASIPTVQGQSLTVAASEKGVMIDGAKVVATDIRCSNGVIHVIDSVVLPREIPATVVDAAVAAGSFKTLIAAAKAAGLAEALMGEGPFTVFAPTDEAFAALGEDTIASLLEPANKAKLVSILKLHVVAGKVPAETAIALAKKEGAAETLLGETLPLRLEKKTLTVGGAKVVKADVEAGNGIIHVIDSVLLPANTDER